MVLIFIQKKKSGGVRLFAFFAVFALVFCLHLYSSCVFDEFYLTQLFTDGSYVFRVVHTDVEFSLEEAVVCIECDAVDGVVGHVVK